MDDDGIKIRFFPSEKTLLARVEGVLDDRLMSATAARMLEHPDFNGSEHQVYDLRASRPGRLTFNAVRQHLAKSGTHPAAGVEVTVVLGADHEAIRQAFETHAWSLPHTLRYCTDGETVDRLYQRAASADARLDERLGEITREAQQVLARIESRTRVFESAFLTDLDSTLCALAPRTYEMYKRAQRAQADGQTRAVVATLHELLRHLVEGVRGNSLAEKMVELASTGELTKYLVPLIAPQKDTLLATGEDDEVHVRNLQRIVAVMLIYRVLAPRWVMERLDPAADG